MVLVEKYCHAMDVAFAGQNPVLQGKNL